MNITYNENVCRFGFILIKGELNLYVPLLLSQFLDRAVKLYGKKTALIDDDKSFTYAEINERVNQLSRGLNYLGVKKGTVSHT